MTKAMKERPRLLCTLIQEMDGTPQVQSIVDSCERCGKAVWRALSSNKRAIAICPHCLLEAKVSGATLVMQPISKRQRDDIAKAPR